LITKIVQNFGNLQTDGSVGTVGTVGPISKDDCWWLNLQLCCIVCLVVEGENYPSNSHNFSHLSLVGIEKLTNFL